MDAPTRSGLRPIWLNAKSPAKVALIVAPGDELLVSDDVAAQLQAADSHFRDGPAPVTPIEATPQAAAAETADDSDVPVKQRQRRPRKGAAEDAPVEE